MSDTHENCPRDRAGLCDWTEWTVAGNAAPLDEHRYCQQCGIDEWRETPAPGDGE